MMTKKNQQPLGPSPTKEVYTQYTVRLRKGSRASQGLAQHAQRFNSRYEAGWLTTLIEEFYVLLDGPDPRASRHHAASCVKRAIKRQAEGEDRSLDLTEQQEAAEICKRHQGNSPLTSVCYTGSLANHISL